ncbi:putative F420-dependent NADPH reductase [Caenibius tardaugens NBRC 16725]|uniref:Putative F420-dependent NADPH reductase n=1 Tax=Caenibius tardaugens NBRC 16725 TaxID=1219035 RepID=U2Y5U3_9SPHN|nr:NADPH-dependent F420 reductase [Caenibius tardaugens]AZI34956.1 NADPH-dependent F420 reductase [Caenibius tardaugens NBRC 16725]GAD48501.1 putative F420-dependent NADPH reductase [Caenibius tardaugens NBRC 16725]
MADNKAVIAVLGGTGHEGAGLAARWAKAGYRVVIGSRDAGRAADAAAEMAAKTGGDVRGLANADAAAAGEIVVLAVPYAGQKALANDVRAQLEGKILIDVTVPLVPPKVARVQLPEGGSAVEALQKDLGEGVRVVAAFQNVSAHQLADLDAEVNCDVLVAGDDIEARETVVQLARAIGITALHAGPLANSAAAEALTSVLIAINKRYKVADGAGIRITGIPDLA